MNFKKIDCKMKEIYFNISPISVEAETEKNINNFWASMDIVGMQNLTLQKICAA